MPVLSDITIRDLCTPPFRHVWHDLVEQVDEQSWIGKHNPAYDVDNDGIPMISPFHPDSIKRTEEGLGIASYGLSSYGYDIRAAAEFKIFKQATQSGILDYKNFNEDLFDYTEEEEILIPPNGFILARSVEYVKIPKNVLALCIGKSTIARAGINCLCTPLEPGWEGHITLEFSNTTSLPNKFYANEGVLQLVFLRGDHDCLTTYADRKGKYQGQGSRIILPRV